MGISVLSTPYGPTQAVAELTLGMILGLIRHAGTSTAEMRQGQWTKRMGFLLSEMTVGIVGLGKVGKRLAGMLRALGGRVLGCDKALDLAWCGEHQVTPRTWGKILPEADILCLHLPLEKELRHLVGKREIARMKWGSFLTNTSRGGLVDERALYEALRSGQLAGAALDTFEEEPYHGPLRKLRNVILTPHIGSYARAGRIAMEREAAENLIGELRRRRLLKPL